MRYANSEIKMKDVIRERRVTAIKSNQIKSNQIKESGGEQTQEKASQEVSNPKIKTGAGSIPDSPPMVYHRMKIMKIVQLSLRTRVR